MSSDNTDHEYGNVYERTLRTALVACYIGSVISFGFAANAAFNGTMSQESIIEIVMKFVLPSLWTIWGGIWMAIFGGILEAEIKRIERLIDFLSTSTGTALFSGAVVNGELSASRTPAAMAMAREERNAFEYFVWSEAAKDKKRLVSTSTLFFTLSAPIIAIVFPLLARIGA